MPAKSSAGGDEAAGQAGATSETADRGGTDRDAAEEQAPGAPGWAPGGEGGEGGGEGGEGGADDVGQPPADEHPRAEASGSADNGSDAAPPPPEGAGSKWGPAPEGWDQAAFDAACEAAYDQGWVINERGEWVPKEWGAASADGGADGGAAGGGEAAAPGGEAALQGFGSALETGLADMQSGVLVGADSAAVGSPSAWPTSAADAADPSPLDAGVAAGPDRGSLGQPLTDGRLAAGTEGGDTLAAALAAAEAEVARLTAERDAWMWECEAERQRGAEARPGCA